MREGKRQARHVRPRARRRSRRGASARWRFGISIASPLGLCVGCRPSRARIEEGNPYLHVLRCESARSRAEHRQTSNPREHSRSRALLQSTYSDRRGDRDAAHPAPVPPLSSNAPAARCGPERR